MTRLSSATTATWFMTLHGAASRSHLPWACFAIRAASLSQGGEAGSLHDLDAVLGHDVGRRPTDQHAVGAGVDLPTRRPTIVRRHLSERWL